MKTKTAWRPLFVTNFLGSLNDNFLKNLVCFIGIHWIVGHDPSKIVSYASALLVIPFVLFSPLAGKLAKTQVKHKVVVWNQFAEIPIMLLAVVGFATQSIALVLISVFLMGTQSALTSPSKFGLIRDIGGTQGISFGTGAMDMLLFVAVLSGTILASVLADYYNIYIISGLLTLIAVAGWLSSKKIKATETEPESNGTYLTNPVSYLIQSYKSAKDVKHLNRIIFGIALFWLFGSLLQMTLIVHGPGALGISNSLTGIILASAATGIGLGCYLAGVLSRKQVSLHLVPIGNAGMLVGAVITYFSHHVVLFTVGVFITALFSGFYKVPLNAWIQANVKGRKLGEMLAYMNMLVYIFISVSAAIFGIVTSLLNTQAMLLVLIVIAVFTAFYLYIGIPSLRKAFSEKYLHQSVKGIQRITVNPNGTIPEQFIKTFNTNPNKSFAYDQTSGQSNRKTFKLKAFVVAEILKKEVEGKQVGIMLPALQSTVLLIVACYLAGKVPVMLNWTVGKNVLDACIKKGEVKTIITAGKFLAKIEDKISDEAKQKCLLLEHAVKKMHPTTKLKGIGLHILSRVPKPNPNDVAVILFTSGSESLPKTVPLTHRNILSNLSGAFSVVDLYSDSKLVGILPPFHSFGFTVLSILPLVSGLEVVYSPDPTNSKTIVQLIGKTKANTLMATPTFLKLIARSNRDDILKNIRLTVTGAESLSAQFAKEYQLLTADNSRILEGYGITECSPILCVNPMNLQKEGSVGKFIDGIDYLIVHPESLMTVPVKTEGLILVKGNSIFNGYLDDNLTTPFVNMFGNKYYNTGDIGYIDEDHYLVLTGRLKRFIKIGGEMISLPAIEQVLAEKFGSHAEVDIAVEGNDKIAPPLIVLFSKNTMNVREVNKYLRERGFSNLVKISKHIKVKEIPLLGTGKTNYRELKQLIS